MDSNSDITHTTLNTTFRTAVIFVWSLRVGVTNSTKSSSVSYQVSNQSIPADFWTGAQLEWVPVESYVI